MLLAFALIAGCAGPSKQAVMHYDMGLSYIKDNQFQPAYIEFQKALEYDKSNKDIYNALGFVYLKFDDLQNAKNSFQKAVSLDKNYSDAYNNLCTVEIKMKLYDQGIADCKKALLNPLYETPQKAFYNIALANYREQKYDDAVNEFKSALLRAPDFYPAYYGLALAYKESGDYGSASDALGKAVKLDPAFKGDMKKAEDEIGRKASVPVEEDQTRNLLEIFRY